MPPAKFSIPERARPYTDALRDVVRVGLWAWLPDAASPLLEMFGDEDGRQNEASLVRGRTRLVEAIKAAVDEKMEGDFRSRMLALLGMREWSNQPLSKRQEFVGSIYPSTGQNWEGFRKEPLDRHLLSLFISLETQKYQPAKPEPPVTDDLGYETVQYHSRCDLGSGETVQRRIIRALRDNVTHWEIAVSTWGRSEEVSLLGDGTLTRHSEGEIRRTSRGTSYFLRVDLPKPLRRDEEFAFTLLRREEPNLDRPTGWLDQRQLTPRLSMHRATLEMVFPRDRHPPEVWAFGDMAPWLVPGVPSAGMTLATGEDGVVRFSWPRPTERRSCGIAWQW